MKIKHFNKINRLSIDQLTIIKKNSTSKNEKYSKKKNLIFHKMVKKPTYFENILLMKKKRVIQLFSTTNKLIIFIANKSDRIINSLKILLHFKIKMRMQDAPLILFIRVQTKNLLIRILIKNKKLKKKILFNNFVH